MKKDKKMKFSKFKIAKINNLELKGGIESNACITVLSYEIICDSIEICNDTIKSRTTGSL